jgi:hypothetical protein
MTDTQKHQVEIVMIYEYNAKAAIEKIQQLLDDGYEVHGYSNSVDPRTSTLVGSVLMVKPPEVIATADEITAGYDMLGAHFLTNFGREVDL